MKVDNIRHVRSFVLRLQEALALFSPIFNNNNEEYCRLFEYFVCFNLDYE